MNVCNQDEGVKRLRSKRVVSRLGRNAKQFFRVLLRGGQKVIYATALWISASRVFWSVIAIGLALAHFARFVPIIGETLALLALALTAVHAFSMQVDADRRRRFRDAYSSREADCYDGQMM